MTRHLITRHSASAYGYGYPMAELSSISVRQSTIAVHGIDSKQQPRVGVTGTRGDSLSWSAIALPHS